MTTGYFITGASGFIGKRLVAKILARDNTVVYYLSRSSGQKGEKQRAALLEYTRDRVPLNWATTQNNLGIALQTLGARESGIARLE